MLAFKACWSASGGYGQSLSFVDDHIFIVVVDRDSTTLNACVYLHGGSDCGIGAAKTGMIGDADGGSWLEMETMSSDGDSGSSGSTLSSKPSSSWFVQMETRSSSIWVC